MRILRRLSEVRTLPPSGMRRLLEHRLHQLDGSRCEFILIEPGDGITELDHQLGGWLLSESGAFDPPFVWLAHHPEARCHELVMIFGDDGEASVLIVPDEPFVDDEIRVFCRARAEPPD